MNDSPGWATPGPSPSDGERQGAPEGRPASDDSKWSAQQPPPGQWSSPADGTSAPQTPPQAPAPGPGWGSYGQQYGAPQAGAYGHPGGPGQWGRPPAAKPGVIPLRPLGLGEILDGAVSTMRTHWRSVLPVTLVVATVIQIVSLLVQKFLMADLVVTTDPERAPDLSQTIDDLGSSLSLTAVTTVIQILGTIVATAMLTMIYSRAVLGRGSSVSAAWRDARPQLPRLIGLTLLLALGFVAVAAVLLGAALLAEGTTAALLVLLLIPFLFALTLWLGISFSLASPALMLERTTVRKAFGRSWKLVKGSWWRILGITLLTGLITTVIGWIIIGPLTAIGIFAFGGGVDGLMDGSAGTAWGTLILAGIGGIIAQTITMPISAGVTVLLYVDQRIRREGLDLELARAAGVQDYGDGNNNGTGATGG
ncbi:glycerophosphoryl diester phosphodiesterase membrane domain-containing protein [Streptomyces sp. NPDC058655]|uniref:glycerophosphoryl diester phosphodiesterase membrane domain-containing protein n=1 Tax=unclassified Streptomyces TaxID=2593676 RepID=UPI003650D571